MEYEWYEDSDSDGNTEDQKTSPVKQEAKEVGSRPSTITLSSDDQMEAREVLSSGGEEAESDGYDAEDDPFDSALIYEKEAPFHEFLKEDVKIAAKTWHKMEEDLCIPSVQIENPISGHEGFCAVVLTLNVSILPDRIRTLWELGDAMTVAVIVDGIHKREYRAFSRRPVVLARIDSNKPSKFCVGECLSNVVKPVIEAAYTMKENQSPAEVGSFFSMLYEQLLERLRTLTEWCMVCGVKLYAGGLLPSICGGELCQYQYVELGLLDGLSTPRVSASVLSLLLMAFNAAVTSPRWGDILTPAPSARDKERLVLEAKKLYKKLDRKWVFVETGGLDVHSMLGCAMPCPKDILQTAAHYREFKKTSPSIAEFVEWLTISNQSYLEEVPVKLNVVYLQTAKQFLFVADTPAKQAEFETLVSQNGGRTRYLFHGSKMENWHSIIRSGLKNMSGTKYQLVGAAYGPGIYLSPELATSHHYCTRFDERHISQCCVSKKCCMSAVTAGGTLALLAVVEVVDTPQAYRHNQAQIVVVTDEKWCSIRMLVAYSGALGVNLDQITPEARKQIQDVAHMFKTADVVERVKHA
ncbi:hypothetical protein PENTCL1PPCAC_2801 [Pristionchus entomophagus]|uniref:Poly [ADP-ribose] polymerase n=1 Tax=Pristionchus entomophagus TaxID=358040 RepID=A0AAV5SBI0_9BILA|nr:hypothetical protein PENTCL1PPCAC_2801 [Pristionchus entomophagus]